MKLHWMKASFASLALAITAWGCDSVSESRLTGPNGGADQALVEYLVNGVRVVEETDPSVGVVSGTFDAAGGRLVIGDHSLLIPEKAVAGPTIFTMGKLSDDLNFGLHATSVGSLVVNDVGRAGFAVPVRLRISYAKTGLTDSDADKLLIVWLKPLGGSETQETKVDKDKDRVIGAIKHFSDYALIFP